MLGFGIPSYFFCFIYACISAGMGGSEMDHCGLWLDGSLLYGVTRHSAVFKSQPLLVPTAAEHQIDGLLFTCVQFGIYAVELWHVPTMMKQVSSHHLHQTDPLEHQAKAIAWWCSHHTPPVPPPFPWGRIGGCLGLVETCCSVRCFTSPLALSTVCAC